MEIQNKKATTQPHFMAIDAESKALKGAASQEKKTQESKERNLTSLLHCSLENPSE